MNDDSDIAVANGRRRRAILVLGMHRSGTSALTRTFSLCGAELPGGLMPATAYNERGYWESEDIRKIHDELLAALGSSWDDTSPVPASWQQSESARPFRDRIVDILQRDFADAPLFVIKDPRVCRLVPFWLTVLQTFGAEPLAVIPLRNPLEIAASLEARDGFPTSLSLLLWLRHLLDAERDTRGLRRSVVSYDGLLADWRSTIARIGADLGLDWPPRSSEMQQEITGFLSGPPRHHIMSLDELWAAREAGDWVKHAYAAALALIEKEESALEELDVIRAAFDMAEPNYRPLVAAHRREIEAGKARISHLEAQIARHDAQIAALLSSNSWRLTGLLRAIKPGFQHALNSTKASAAGAARVIVPRLESTTGRILGLARKWVRVARQDGVRSAFTGARQSSRER